MPPLCVLNLVTKGHAQQRSKYMANGILNQLNKSLEITMRDGLYALEDFTLQMAYANPCAQLEILSIDDAATNPTPLKRVDTPVVDITPQLPIQRQRHG